MNIKFNEIAKYMVSKGISMLTDDNTYYDFDSSEISDVFGLSITQIFNVSDKILKALDDREEVSFCIFTRKDMKFCIDFYPKYCKRQSTNDTLDRKEYNRLYREKSAAYDVIVALSNFGKAWSKYINVINDNIDQQDNFPVYQVLNKMSIDSWIDNTLIDILQSNLKKKKEYAEGK